MLSLGALVALTFANPATAAADPDTRLVRCADGHCLLVSGHRDDTASLVRINGHAVSVAGRHHWRVRLPIETVRAWSAPFARTIRVALIDPETQSESVAQADLPIGMLGHITNLASLVVSVQ